MKRNDEDRWAMTHAGSKTERDLHGCKQIAALAQHATFHGKWCERLDGFAVPPSFDHGFTLFQKTERACLGTKRYVKNHIEKR